jgi:hypothetical protein
VASGKDQKEQARAKRLAEEQARVERERRQRRLGMLSGVALLAAALVAIAIAISSGSSSSANGLPSPTTPATTHVVLPAWRIKDLPAAARAAGCTRIDTPDSIARTDQNRAHVDPGTNVNYQTSPPSYGPHYPDPASDGEYAPDHTPEVGYLVHAMEHGRVEYQYRPGLPPQDLTDLEALFNETDGQVTPGQLLLLFQNKTGMRYDVAATAWGHVLGCRTFNPRVFDALRDFRLAYTDKGPEQMGLGPE